MNDTQTLALIAKDSPKLLEAAGLGYNNQWYWKSPDSSAEWFIEDSFVVALLRDAIVMDLWEKTELDLFTTPFAINAAVIKGDYSHIHKGDTPLAALYAAWLKMGPGTSEELLEE